MPAHGRSFRRFLPPNTALTQFLVLTVLLPILFFGFAAYRDWRDIEAQAATRIVHMRDALAEHALRVFKTHRVIAYAVGDRIAGMRWEAVAASPALHDYLTDITTDFPEVRAISVVDEAGGLRASSRAFPVAAEDYSAQPWFEELRQGAHWVAIQRSEAPSEEDGFTVSFRRGGAVFRGVVRIMVSPAYFEAFYASAYTEEGVIVLARDDGALLVRAPAVESATPGRIPPQSAFFTTVAEASGSFFAEPSSVDGVMRYYGFARVGDFPVHVGVGLVRQEFFRLWRNRIQSYGAYFIPAGVALLLLALHAWRSHRSLEHIVDARTGALSAAIAEKDQLLKEVHHRVKNNMQIISSLIRMQERVETSPDDTIRRVQAMAMVHDLIYTDGEFASVDLAAYTLRMCDSLRGASSSDIAFETSLEPATVALERAMPFALILSEIVTNAVRHAFPDARGTIDIELKTQGGEIELGVRDDGIGHDHVAGARGFGMRLVKSLAVQLDARIAYERRDGTHFRMTFPAERLPPVA